MGQLLDRKVHSCRRRITIALLHVAARHLPERANG